LFQAPTNPVTAQALVEDNSPPQANARTPVLHQTAHQAKPDGQEPTTL
jgi:hypothetical protein